MGAPRFMKAFATHGDLFASAAVAPQGASRWHLNQIYCECEAFTVKPRRVCRPQAAKRLEWRIVKSSATQYHKKPHREISILDTFWDGDS